ncbi:hypothetical protein CH341_26780 [Rhodoplanes roseus]|uniref:GYF domain-containing protein n=2 Tax=Rhodoplanes roseus TaxID=29409 RepID=A0A327KNR2_9BRAD|nr:hypothetical protein CH341_26780 [Rhodoplanes roseus]
MSDTTSTPAASDEWFYTLGGQRLGPISSSALRQLLDDRKVHAETPVWRRGQTSWMLLRETEFGLLLSEVPPPVAAANINNSFVWALAVMPIVYVVLTAVLQVLLSSQELFTLISLVLPFGVNAALCLLDLSQLKRAGYSDGFLTLWALILAPVYLFVRAKRIGHTPTYAITWVVTFAISVLLS